MYKLRSNIIVIYASKTSYTIQRTCDTISIYGWLTNSRKMLSLGKNTIEIGNNGRISELVPLSQ